MVEKTICKTKTSGKIIPLALNSMHTQNWSQSYHKSFLRPHTQHIFFHTLPPFWRQHLIYTCFPMGNNGYGTQHFWVWEKEAVIQRFLYKSRSYLLKKRLWLRCFEICRILKNTFFIEHLLWLLIGRVMIYFISV